MNNTLHTPGSWTHTPSREHSNPNTTRRDIVAESQFGPAFIAGDVSQSDASLISAAPDLLSALESAYNAIAWDIPGGNLSDQEEETLLDVIREALRKAKGEA
jgi:hypothetical protein